MGLFTRFVRIFDPTTPWDKSPEVRVVDALTRAVDITSSTSPLSRGIDTVTRHADVTNPNGALGALASVITGSDEETGASVEARRLAQAV